MERKPSGRYYEHMNEKERENDIPDTSGRQEEKIHEDAERRVRFTETYSGQALPFERRPDASQKEKIPAKIRKMRNMLPEYGSYLGGSERYFYRQALFMEDYEDNYEFRGRFFRYMPTYQSMSLDQLRGYFSWRTQERKLEKAILEETDGKGLSGTEDFAVPEGTALPDAESFKERFSFLYVYSYEILENIGAGSPEDGYHKLLLLDYLYGKTNSEYHAAMHRWLRDYVVYYDLDHELAARYYKDDAAEDIRRLLSFEKEAAEEAVPEKDPEEIHAIFEALMYLSTKDLTASPVYKQNPPATEKLAVRIYAELCRYYRKSRKHSPLEQAFGERRSRTYRMFGSAVFYDHLKYADFTYEADFNHIFHCRGGGWTCETYREQPGKNRLFGRIFQEADRQLREKYQIGRPLKKQTENMVISGIVGRTIEADFAERIEASRPKVHLDLSRLDSIRQDAAHTREQLLTEEERETADREPVRPAAEKIMPDPEEYMRETQAAPAAGEVLLSEDQIRFLRLLLEDGDWKAFQKEHHLSIALLVDSINEAFYDEIGDTVIELDGETPSLLEDYIEDVKEFLN